MSIHFIIQQCGGQTYLTAIQMATGYTPGQLVYTTYYPENNYGVGNIGIIGTNGLIYTYNTIQLQNEMGYNISQTRRFANEPWGIYQLAFGGYYYQSSPSSTSFSMDINGSGWVSSVSSTDYWGSYTSGNWNTNQTIDGSTFGYGEDISSTTPMTWISVGETIGTFDPIAQTWQAVQMGSFIETTQFLAMVAANDTATLTALNIPFAEVGKADLTGAGTMGDGAVTVTMQDVTFFAYKTGDAPKIWATGNVNGAYTCSTCGSTTLGLTSTRGGSLDANFNIQTFDNTGSKTWAATVNGSGNLDAGGNTNYYTGQVQMNGAAAGTIDTSTTTFSGTAAGTAQ